ncbi:hypothetical protein Tco_1403544 [Tanacetum coccineum]
MEKGFPIFLAHVTTKEIGDKSERRRDLMITIVHDFPEVSERLAGSSSELDQVEFQMIWYWCRTVAVGTLSIGAFEMRSYLSVNEGAIRTSL